MNGDDPKCAAHSYSGKDRRVAERRADECIWHEAHETRFLADERDIVESKRCITLIKEDMKSKVPMKLFYTIVGLIVLILGVQWQTYEKVNVIALEHTEAMGEISTSIVEIKSEVAHGNEASTYARTVIKDSLDQTRRVTDEKMAALQEGIEEINETIDELHNN